MARPTALSPAPSVVSRNALLAPPALHVFELLDVAITLWQPGSWHEIHERPYALDIIGFELEHSLATERVRYNNRHLALAQRERRTVIGQRLGLTDLFVPVHAGGHVAGVLVTGPFATEHPTAADILSRWRALVGSQGDPRDPEFSHFLEVTLATLVLEGDRLRAFQELTESVAALMAQSARADELLAKIDALGSELVHARLVDRTWTIAQALVDERTSRSWSRPERAVRLAEVGLDRFPELVLAGLFVAEQSSLDPVDEALRRDAFQRACVALAHAAGNAICGRTGSHGITLLAESRGSHKRTRRFLVEFAQRASALAHQRFGLRLHAGISGPSESLSQQYRAALDAAEAALVQGVPLEESSEVPRRRNSAASLRRELGRLVEQEPSALTASFDRYAEAVTLRAGHRLDLTRSELDAGFERIEEAFRSHGAMDDKSLDALCETLASSVDEASTVSELLSAYRRVVREIADAVIQPRAARRDRSLRRAEEYMRRHYSEALTLARVARECGFTPNYFSELFRTKMGITFEQRLIALRVERARQLLASTSLNLGRIAELCGCSTREYLGRMFKRVTGETPIAYRTRIRRELTTGVNPKLPLPERTRRNRIK